MKYHIILSTCVLVLSGCSTVYVHDDQPLAVSGRVENIQNEVTTPIETSVSEHIIVDTPQMGEQIASPLVITGRAKGWFFEGNFPVELVSGDGTVIAYGYAQAQEDWMSDAFISFTAELQFDVPQDVTDGVLILRKANPSDEPVFDEHIGVPVIF